MHSEIERSQFHGIIPLFESLSNDPMLFATLEGNTAGRVWVDHVDSPQNALIWSGMEYAYLGGKAPPESFLNAVEEVINSTILPALEESGVGFISIFPFDEETRQELLERFHERTPTSFGVNTYHFNLKRFADSKPPSLLPEGLACRQINREILSHPKNEGTREDILFCWETIDHFLDEGLGTCIEIRNIIISACYAIAYGANGYHVNIWTHPDHRRQGLAYRSVRLFIETCLSNGKSLYWLNDSPNDPSRALAESLGYELKTDLYPVDIPVDPFSFNIGLGNHFYHYIGDPRTAAALYEKAVSFQPDSGDANYDAARARAALKEPDKALERLKLAIAKGWKGIEVYENEDVFDPWRDHDDWISTLSLIRR